MPRLFIYATDTRHSGIADAGDSKSGKIILFAPGPKYLPKKYDARTLELIDPLIDLAPIDKTPSTADLLEEGTPPSPAPVVVSSPVIRNRAGSA